MATIKAEEMRSPMEENPFKGEPGGLNRLIDEVLADLIIKVPGLDQEEFLEWIHHPRIWDEDIEEFVEDFPRMVKLAMPERPPQNVPLKTMDRWLKRVEGVKAFNNTIANIRIKTMTAIKSRCDPSFYLTWEKYRMDAKVCMDYLVDTYGQAAQGFAEYSFQLADLLCYNMVAPESLLSYWTKMEKKCVAANITNENLLSILLIHGEMTKYKMCLLPNHLHEGIQYVIDHGLGYEEAKRWLVKRDTNWRMTSSGKEWVKSAPTGIKDAKIRGIETDNEKGGSEKKFKDRNMPQGKRKNKYITEEPFNKDLKCFDCGMVGHRVGSPRCRFHKGKAERDAPLPKKTRKVELVTEEERGEYESESENSGEEDDSSSESD